jgi:hypothetical protein
MGRRLRRWGLVFTDDQRLARWEDRGGPGRVERWSLGGSVRYRIARFIPLAAGILAAPLVYGWLRPDATAFTQPYLVGASLGVFLATVFAGGFYYRRERRLYDRWRAGERASRRDRG